MELNPTIILNSPDIAIHNIRKIHSKWIDDRLNLLVKLQESNIKSYKSLGLFILSFDPDNETHYEIEWLKEEDINKELKSIINTLNPNIITLYFIENNSVFIYYIDIDELNNSIALTNL